MVRVSFNANLWDAKQNGSVIEIFESEKHTADKLIHSTT
jgi:hypothetical protein